MCLKKIFSFIKFGNIFVTILSKQIEILLLKGKKIEDV